MAGARGPDERRSSSATSSGSARATRSRSTVIVTERRDRLDESARHRASRSRWRSGPGDALIGGSINVSQARVTFEATEVGADTVLGPDRRLWWSEAQNSKAPGQRLADRAAAVLVDRRGRGRRAHLPGWAVFSDDPFLTALTFAISAVVIACPDALGPRHTDRRRGRHRPRRAAQHPDQGRRHARRAIGALDAIVLDKTGTLTEGEPAVTDLIALDGSVEDELLRLVAAPSRPPSIRCRGDRRGARGRGSRAREASEFDAVAGLGIEASRRWPPRSLLGNAPCSECGGASQRSRWRCRRAGCSRVKTVDVRRVDGRALGVIARRRRRFRPTAPGCDPRLKVWASRW